MLLLCPKCHSEGNIRDEYVSAGTQLKCPCGHIFVLNGRLELNEVKCEEDMSAKQAGHYNAKRAIKGVNAHQGYESYCRVLDWLRWDGTIRMKVSEVCREKLEEIYRRDDEIMADWEAEGFPEEDYWCTYWAINNPYAEEELEDDMDVVAQNIAEKVCDIYSLTINDSADAWIALAAHGRDDFDKHMDIDLCLNKMDAMNAFDILLMRRDVKKIFERAQLITSFDRNFLNSKRYAIQTLIAEMEIVNIDRKERSVLYRDPENGKEWCIQDNRDFCWMYLFLPVKSK